MNKHTILFLSLMSLVASVPLTGAAQEDPTEDTGRGPSYRFGGDGQLAISSDAAIEITHTSPGSRTNITLAPAIDYFIIENFSLGGFLLLDYTTVGDSDQTTFGLGPRVGYNFPLSDAVSIWPKAGFSFSSTSYNTDDADDSNSALALNLFVPFMFHPVTHFFAGFGPFLDVDLTGDDKSTRIGARLTLGGWFET